MEIPQVYKFVENGKEIAIPIEAYGWQAIYKDGSFLKQFDELSGKFHQFKEIELEKLDVFVMQSVTDASRRYEIHIKEGMTSIHYYRNATLNFGTPQQQKIRLYCFGYKEKIGGKSVKTIIQIHPNGALAIMNDDGRSE